ncbi:hypothetical protein BDW59DRAFT_130136 [Aspergillus cavernicola]|uniref:Uncharacterized protein n=1 Tax=Aspergillus cavernicola TaxID=176166 RepID=A0ABR4HQX3_9EURO
MPTAMQLRTRRDTASNPEQQPSVRKMLTRKAILNATEDTARGARNNRGTTQKWSSHQGLLLEEILVGESLPDHVLDMGLGTHRGKKTSLRAVLEKSEHDILVLVFPCISKQRFQEEFGSTYTTNLYYPNINLTTVAISSYPVSIFASLLEDAIEAPEEDMPEVLLSDPRLHFLDAMGFVRPPPATKAAAARMRRQGPVRHEFFVVRKAGILLAKGTGTSENVNEAIARVHRKIHSQWVSDLRRRGKPIPPW